MRIALTGGAYTARSLIASAQRQVNLMSEKKPAGSIIDLGHGAEDTLATLYPTPGLRQLAIPPTPGPARGLYWANNDTLFYACGGALYRVNADWSMASLGSIAGPLATPSTPVSMADNGLTMVLVDGTANGWQVDLTTLAFAAINAAPTPSGNAPTVASTAVYGFYGADRIVPLDGFLLLNQPGTRNFYCTYNGEVVFDSLYIAAKNGYSDDLVSIAVNQRNIWLIGERTTEIWYNAGASDFPFAIMPGPFVQHGCAAKYSVAQVNESVYWLTQDQAGRNIVVRTTGYQAARVSTHAIESEWGTYTTTTDAVGFTFQQGGHAFYQLNFPAADKSWRFDEATGEWHEAVWLDSNGTEHRHRAGCVAHAYGQVVVADWETGALYALDPTAFTDAGNPIKRLRAFPHLVADGKRVVYRQFVADMQTGAGT
jgi:hypothetical protein